MSRSHRQTSSQFNIRFWDCPKCGEKHIDRHINAAKNIRDDVDSGIITIDGIPLSKIQLSELHANIGVLNQDFARYQLSAKDNIGFGLRKL
ncbi:MAG: hypothetical protein ACFCU7_19985 [Pleurocapsa sp.]